MSPEEIRALRGELSRAAFARQLGVTKLTVLRWELPEDSKESRRPRAAAVAALRALAARDDEAAALPAKDAAFEEIAPLVEGLRGEHWERAGEALVELLGKGTLSPAGRVLASCGVAEMHLLLRGDKPTCLATLGPVFQELRGGELPPSVRFRVHVIAALLFSSLDSRTFDAGRANAHLARIDELASYATDDDRVAIAYVRFMLVRLTGPGYAAAAYEAGREELTVARSPLMRVLAAIVQASAFQAMGDTQRAAAAARQVDALTEQNRFFALQLSALQERVSSLARGTGSPEAILALAQRAREVAAGLPWSENLVSILASEVEAHSRLGKVRDAAAVAEEAMRGAKDSGIPRFCLAWPVANLCVMADRVAELDALADDFATDTVGGRGGRADLHAVIVRQYAATLACDYVRANDLIEEARSLPATTAGLQYLTLILHVANGYGKLLLHDVAGARDALAALDAALRQRPSVQYSALLFRMQGYLAMQHGHTAEARQKLEASLETFALLGDAYQQAFAKAQLALLAVETGEASAQAEVDRAYAELRRFGSIAPALMRRREALAAPPTSERWSELSVAERLLVAVEQLSVPGVAPDAVAPELRAILQTLFPGHAPVVALEEPQTADAFATALDGKTLFIGVRGRLTGEERAALAYLATCFPHLVDRTPPAPFAADGFVAAAEPMRRLKADLQRLAESNATILITGESGVGKEVVARAVHDLSMRAKRPYVVLNCASVPRELFESQLFGHKRGAFTGATSDSPGVIRAADGGTLFLDEIGELPLDLQPKLLRFLENNEILPVGEHRSRRVDVRVVAATHRRLGDLVRDGRFRADLFFRLNVVPVHVPPLRDRTEDILALARMFLARMTPEGEQTPELSRGAAASLTSHAWPGNVRELRNVIERATAFSPLPRVIHADDLRV